MTPQSIQNLLDEQLASWQTVRDNYAALTQVRIKEVQVNGTHYKVQFNPARIVSSTAKVDSQSIQARKCFLCSANRPAEQKGIPFKDKYQILVNPFPIFPKHLTAPALEHTDQRIKERFADMLDLAAFAQEYVVFYNGPHCGASAPDHIHFQAGNKGFLPIEDDWKARKAAKVGVHQAAALWAMNDALRSTLIIESPVQEDAVTLFNMIYRTMETKPGEEEPMLNLLVWKENGSWVIFIFPRHKHRPTCYTAEGDANRLISPASVDMGGVFITPRKEDFEKLTATDIATILSEVCLPPVEFKKLIQRIIEQL